MGAATGVLWSRTYTASFGPGWYTGLMTVCIPLSVLVGMMILLHFVPVLRATKNPDGLLCTERASCPILPVHRIPPWPCHMSCLLACMHGANVIHSPTSGLLPSTVKYACSFTVTCMVGGEPVSGTEEFPICARAHRGWGFAGRVCCQRM